MEYLLSQIINGLCQGAIYALLAIGYSSIVGVVGLVTFTYGEIIMFGAFAGFYFFNIFGNNIFLGILSSFMASFVIGIFVYKICYEHFFKAPRHVSLLCTIGCSMLLKNLAQMIFGPNQKPLLGVVESRFYGTDTVHISMLQIIIITTVLVLSTLLALFFNKTKWGICLRAVSQDKEASYLMGINVRRMALLGNCVGCGLGGVGGILLSIHYQIIVATMGGALSMKAFSSSVLGGLTDIRYSALGGLLIGVIENLGISISSASFRDLFAFLFLIIVLMLKPEGLNRKNRR